MIPPTKPTHMRWFVFLSLFVLCTINYVDRSVIFICMPAIVDDLQFGPAVVGVILSSFFWGYTLMQIPSGWLADRIVPGKVLFTSGLFWGVFQVINGMVSSSSAFMAIRALLGITEAPMYPASCTLQSVWLTKNERARGSALVSCGAPLGTALGGPLMIAFSAWLGGWRGALIGTGVLTLVIVLLCYKFVCTTPETNSHINDVEREYLHDALEEEYKSERAAGGDGQNVSLGLRGYFHSLSFWGMNLSFIGDCCVWYGLLTWGPMYLAQVFHVNIMTVGSSVFIIYGSGVVGGLTGGAIVDYFLSKGFDKNKVVKLGMALCGSIIALMMFLLTTAPTITIAIVYLSIAMVCTGCEGVLMWIMPVSISQKKDIGVVSGAMNTLGNLAGAIVPIFLGLIVAATGGDYYWALISFILFALSIPAFGFFVNMKKKITA